MFRPVHYFGCFLLFVASILLLITTISAPIINDISILRVDFSGSDASLTFGTFGYCFYNNGGWSCSPREIGYDPAAVANSVGLSNFGEAGSNTAEGLTRVMVLHPVACGLTFIAFLIASGAGIIGSLMGVLVAFVSWALTLVVMATDFTAFGIIRDDINNSGTNAVAGFGSGMWTLLAAFIIQFFGMVLVFFTCCTDRREKRRNRNVVEPKTDYGVATRRNRWGRWRRN